MITAEARALLTEFRHAAIGLQAATEAAAFRRSLVQTQEADLAVLVLTADVNAPLDRAELAVAVEVLDLHRQAHRDAAQAVDRALGRYWKARSTLLTAHPHLAAFITG